MARPYGEGSGTSDDSDEGGQAFPPRYFRNIGADVVTVVDIGVHKGTGYLYQAFHDRPFILIDPQRDAESLLEDKPARYVFVNKAAGARPGKLELKAQGAKSGFVERTELSRRGGPRETYEVDVATLDDILDEVAPAAPLGVKIDTEGFELEVLRGLDRHASKVRFIICEASIRRRFVESYAFSDLVAAMKSKGFEFYTFLNQPKRRPRFFDVLFLPADHPYFE